MNEEVLRKSATDPTRLELGRWNGTGFQVTRIFSPGMTVEECQDILMAEGSEVARAIEGFIEHLKVTRAPDTARGYSPPLNHLQRFLAEEGITRLPDLDTGHAIQYARWVKPEHNLKHSSLLVYLSAINKFFGWLLDEDMPVGYGESEYLRLQRRLKDVRRMRRGKTVPRLPNEWAVQAMVKAVYDRPQKRPRQRLKRWRDIALLETFISTGARPIEIIGLTRGDLNLVERSALVGAKGGDERTIWWSPQAWSALSRYLVAQGDYPPETPIWLQHRVDGKPLGLKRGAVTEIFHKICNEAGLAERVTPRDLRKRYATGLLAATRDITIAQDALGHRKPETTRYYAGIDDDRVADAVREAHKRGHI